MQIQNLIKVLSHSRPVHTYLTIIETLLIKTDNGLLFQIYQMLSSFVKFAVVYCHTWEKDLSVVFTKHEWKKIKD